MAPLSKADAKRHGGEGLKNASPNFEKGTIQRNNYLVLEAQRKKARMLQKSRLLGISNREIDGPIQSLTQMRNNESNKI